MSIVPSSSPPRSVCEAHGNCRSPRTLGQGVLQAIPVRRHRCLLVGQGSGRSGSSRVPQPPASLAKSFPPGLTPHGAARSGPEKGTSLPDGGQALPGLLVAMPSSPFTGSVEPGPGLGMEQRGGPARAEARDGTGALPFAGGKLGSPPRSKTSPPVHGTPRKRGCPPACSPGITAGKGTQVQSCSSLHAAHFTPRFREPILGSAISRSLLAWLSQVTPLIQLRGAPGWRRSPEAGGWMLPPH